ncbi:uncharacterized protein [Centruroides vittatus]|uniref:uncharacterized protein isoform X1 n=1 Tax=Centruroides vittatus TaxID=120091 RepID=UPI00350ED3FB
MWGSLAIFPVCAILLCLLSLLLQIIILPSSHWGEYSARKDRGNQEEVGHYGLWNLCFRKGQRIIIDCDQLDTFFRRPPHIEAAGYIAIIHILLLLTFLPFAVIRIIQIIKKTSKFVIRPNRLCIIKVTLSFIIVIFAILTTVLASIGENRFVDYVVDKGWAFWVQIFILVVDIFLGLVCALENIQYWQQQTFEAATRDPEGEFSETYGNPTFESPRSVRKYGSELSIAYTDASGHPYPPREISPKHQQRSVGRVDV